MLTTFQKNSFFSIFVTPILMIHIFKEETMLKRIREALHVEVISYENQKTAYSNYVYLFTCSKGKFMYKEYNQDEVIIDKNQELEIQNQLGFPVIVFSKDNYRIEEFSESQNVDFVLDLSKIAVSLKKFHNTVVTCYTSHYEMLTQMVNRQVIKNKEVAFIQKINTNNSTICINDKNPGKNTHSCHNLEDGCEKINDKISSNELPRNFENADSFNTSQDLLVKNDKLINVLNNVKDRVIKSIECEESTLCHNDLQIGNMMLVKGEVKFIDFEYACYGNKYVDIANLFCETMCDYTTDYKLNPKKGYSMLEKHTFLKKYLQNEDIAKAEDSIKSCYCYSHYYWFLWSKYMYQSKRGPSQTFDYKNYALNRLELLYHSDFINEYEYNVLSNF
ncbi:hypothetical protein COBT_000183 [Conglomerata obtusa]